MASHPNSVLSKTAVAAYPAMQLRVDPVFESERTNIARKLAFWFAAALVFIRLSMLHELVTYLTGQNLYFLYLFGPPAIAGMLMTGGVQRTFRSRTALYWAGFFGFMILAVPFSTWPGGSLGVVKTVLRTELPMLFVVAGVAMTWQECRTMIRVIAAAGILPIVSSQLFARDHERLMLDFGAAANANDLAAHLLLVLPFLLFEVFTHKNKFFRLAAFGMVLFGLLAVLTTASRGALVAIVVTCVVFLFRSSRRQRFGLVMLAPVGAMAMLSMLSSETVIRLLSFSEDSEEFSEEAIGSSQSREYLLRRSIEFTLYNPLFGIGPGQFATQEGNASREEGMRGNWHDPHNSYTQISSECGLPALLFQLAAIVSTFLILNRLWVESLKRKDSEVAAAAQCILLSLVAYGVACTFLSLGYKYYFLVLSGLTMALANALYLERWRRLPAPAPVATTPAPRPRSTRLHSYGTRA
jgi:O-antigen ligase